MSLINTDKLFGGGYGVAGNIVNSILSPNDKDFIEDISGILDGSVSLRSISDIMDYVSNPVGGAREFNYDWLIDYFRSQANNDFNFSSATGLLGLDSGKLAQFDRALGLAQRSVEQISKIGFGVGDFVSKMTKEASSLLGSYGSKAAATLREFGPIAELFTYTGILNTPGDPLANDIRSLLLELAEDSGFILSRSRANTISRNFHFISKPYLESDSMGIYHSKVFFTRPNLNLVVLGSDNRYYPHPQLYKYKELSALVESDIELCAELCRDNCRKSNLFPLLSNYCKEVPPIRLNENDRNGIQNKYGFSMPVKSVSNSVGVDITVTFSDNAKGDIAKIFYIMDLYTRAVTNQGYAKRSEYIKYNMIDSAMSFYMVTTDSNWNIISFSPAIGLHISDTVTHFAKHNEEGMSKEDILGDFSVSFKCFDFSAHDPSYYDAFNRISGFDPSRVIDTRGSSRSLYRMPVDNIMRKSYVNDKSITGGHMPHKTSVFDPNYHGYSGGKDIATIKMETVKDTVLNARSLGQMAINKSTEFATSLGLFKDPGKETSVKDKGSAHFGYYLPYPDEFEHLGRYPGVYATLASESESSSGTLSSTLDNKSGTTKRKIVYKLGWSR